MHRPWWTSFQQGERRQHRTTSVTRCVRSPKSRALTQPVSGGTADAPASLPCHCYRSGLRVTPQRASEGDGAAPHARPADPAVSEATLARVRRTHAQASLISFLAVISDTDGHIPFSLVGTMRTQGSRAFRAGVEVGAGRFSAGFLPYSSSSFTSLSLSA